MVDRQLDDIQNPLPAIENTLAGDGVPPVVLAPVDDEILPIEEIPCTRSGRQRRIPKRHADFVPSSLREIPSHIRKIYEAKMNKPSKPIPTPPSHVPEDTAHPIEATVDIQDFADEEDLEPEFYNTEPNEYGVFRQYTTFPQVDPEVHMPLDACIDSPAFAEPQEENEEPGFCKALRGFGRNVARGVSKKNIFAPFKNITTFASCPGSIAAKLQNLSLTFKLS